MYIYDENLSRRMTVGCYPLAHADLIIKLISRNWSNLPNVGGNFHTQMNM